MGGAPIASQLYKVNSAGSRYHQRFEQKLSLITLSKTTKTLSTLKLRHKMTILLKYSLFKRGNHHNTTKPQLPCNARLPNENGTLNIIIYTGLIKSNRPLYVSVSHKQGIRLSDLKFFRHTAHAINVLLTEFQIRTMLHVATMNMWTNALFAVQI